MNAVGEAGVVVPTVAGIAVAIAVAFGSAFVVSYFVVVVRVVVAADEFVVGDVVV